MALFKDQGGDSHATITYCGLILNASLAAICFFALHYDIMENRQAKQYTYIFMFPSFHYLCLSLFLLLFVSHFSFVFCLTCLPSANAFNPRVCGLQPLQPSGLQQPPAGRELRRLQQGNELIEEFGKKQSRKGVGCKMRGRVVGNRLGLN